MGQGKLCCRLNVPIRYLLTPDNDEDDEFLASTSIDLSTPAHASTASNQVNCAAQCVPGSTASPANCFGTVTTINGSSTSTSFQCCAASTPNCSSKPSTSTHRSTFSTSTNSSIISSTTQRPTSTNNYNSSNQNHIHPPTRREEELMNLVGELLEQQGSDLPPEDTLTFKEAVLKLKKEMSDSIQKLKVDEEDVLIDALAYFKDQSYNPHNCLQIRYKGQPGVDTGGILRQFFTDVFNQMCTGADGIPPLFEGGDLWKLPVYNPGLAVSNVMVMVGKMCSHAVIQAGVGPAFLAPPIYRYLCTGDFETVVQGITMEDVTSKTRIYVEKINEIWESKNNDEQKDVLYKQLCCEDTGYQELLVESGCTAVLAHSTRSTIIQNFVVHDVVGKRKTSLDQIRQGLDTLGLLKHLDAYPNLYMKMFVASTPCSAEEIIEKLKFSIERETDANQKVKEFLLQFLQKSTAEVLQEFLYNLSGSRQLPSSVIIKIEKCNGIFFHTCMETIVLPESFRNFEEFQTSIKAAMTSSAKSFTAV